MHCNYEVWQSDISNIYVTIYQIYINIYVTIYQISYQYIKYISIHDIHVTLSRLPSADLTGESQPNFHDLHHQVSLTSNPPSGVICIKSTTNLSTCGIFKTNTCRSSCSSNFCTHRNWLSGEPIKQNPRTEVHLQLWINWPPWLASGNPLYAKLICIIWYEICFWCKCIFGVCAKYWWEKNIEWVR